MSSPTLSNLQLVDNPLRWDLFVTPGAIKFINNGGQNQQIIPRSAITSLVVDDTDFTTIKHAVPRIIGAACVGALLGSAAGYAREHNRLGTGAGAVVGCGLGGIFGWGLFRSVIKHEMSSVSICSSQKCYRFSCTDPDVRALQPLFDHPNPQ